MADIYFDKNLVEFDEIEASADNCSNNLETVFFINQGNTLNLKTSAQKTTSRFLLEQLQNKLFRKHYQNRNFQVLKAEIQTQKSPLILSYHFLVFRNYFFSSPDDIPIS